MGLNQHDLMIGKKKASRMIFSGIPRPELIIFDCDGVLIDSEIIASRIEAQVASDLGYQISADEICSKYMGMPHRILWQDIFEKIGKPMPEDFMDIQRQRLIDAFRLELTQIKNVDIVLKTLPITKCVASSTHKTQLVQNLKHVSLFEYFDDAVFSVSEVERPKPHPDIFLYAAKKMGVEPMNCLVIEDSAPGVRAAISAGMNVVGFIGGSHIREIHVKQLIESGAQSVFEDITSLLEFR